MRKLIVNTFLTLDGVMQAPGGPEEDPVGGFKHGGWSVTYWDDVMGQVMGEAMAKPSDLLLGRKTYEIFAAHWPQVAKEARAREERGDTESSGDDAAAKILDSAKKYVASKTLTRVDWNNSTLLKGSVRDAVAKLKTEPGPDIAVHGSAGLLQTLLAHDLVDRYQLWIFPVVLGGGKRLFDVGTVPRGLKLVDSKTSTSGVIIASYERAGEVPLGSFALDKPTEAEVERRQKLAVE